MLVVAVINVDPCPFFFSFLRPDLSPWGYSNRCFLVALCCLIVRRPNLEVVTKRSLHQQVKMQMSCMEVCPYSYFRWCGYFWGPWVSFVTTDEFSVRVTKFTSRIGVSWTHSLPLWFWPLLTQWNCHITKRTKIRKFESHNSLELSFTNIWGLHSNFVECEFFFESNFCSL